VHGGSRYSFRAEISREHALRRGATGPAGEIDGGCSVAIQKEAAEAGNLAIELGGRGKIGAL
jgi:hypothetical protein